MAAIHCHSLRRQLQPVTLRSGTVPNAAVPCVSREDSLSPRYLYPEFSMPHDVQLKSAPATCFIHAHAENGDGPWSLGCRAYERVCFALRSAPNKHDWLGILQQATMLEFGFTIGTIPFRFYRGKPDDPPENYVIKSFGEVKHLQFCLDIEGLRPVDKILRFAVDVDATREVSSITLVEMDDAANITGTWPIPLDGASSNVSPIQTPAVDLPPVVPQPLTKKDEEQ